MKTTLFSKQNPPIVLNGLLWVVLFALVLWFYHPIFNASFRVVDDTHTFLNLSEEPSWGRRMLHYLEESYFHAGAYYRPLVKMVYDFLLKEWGCPAAVFYGWNLVVHSTNAWFFLMIVRWFLPFHWSIVAALVFALHPLHWEAVLNIAGLSVLMQTMFSLAAMVMTRQYLQARTRVMRTLSLLMMGVCFISAMLSKESGFMTPFVCGWLVWIESRFSTDSQRRRGVLTGIVWAALLCFLIVAVLRWKAGVHHVYTWRSPFEIIHGFLTFCYGFLFVLIRMLIPWPLVYDRGQPLVGAGGVAMLVGIVVFLVWMLRGPWRRRQLLPTGFVFGMGWGVLSLVPISQWWISIGVRPGVISMADHLFYETTLAVILMTLSFVHGLWPRWHRMRRLVFVGLCVWLAAAVVLDQRQVRLAVSEQAMLAESLRFQPFNSRLARALAYLYAMQGDFEQALAFYRQAAQEDPWDVAARIGWGRALMDLGRIEEGLKILEEAQALAAKLDHKDPLLDRNLEEGYHKLAASLRRFIEENPNDPKLWYRWGTIMARLGEVQAAYEGLKKAYALDQGDARILFNLSQVAAAVGDHDLAQETRQRFQSLPVQSIPDELKSFHSSQ